MNCAELLERLKLAANPEAVAGMARFGITPTRVYGVSIPELRKLAREVGNDHELAQQLWTSGIHDAQILASMIDDPKQVTDAQLERWVLEFDSWDLCDQCCNNLFRRTTSAYQKALDWSAREEEFVKRAGFVLMAALAVHDKRASDHVFERFLPIIKRENTDNRNFVKKAVNWALRQIGKRNSYLNARAIAIAEELRALDSTTAHWIAANALRELTGEKVQQRVR
ncbi:MAG: DNA alkylation repair protein [Candidatus Methanospirareceae archaeon]